MIVTHERLNGAMTPEQYLESMHENRERFASNIAAVRITEEERAFFAGQPAPLQVLVLSEDWCPDCTTNVPIIVRLARETGGLQVHLLHRDGNEDLADQYQRADGRNHIPTYIFFDPSLKELGHFIERPAAVTQKLQEFRASWYAAHPETDPQAPQSTLPADLRAQFSAEYADARHQLWDLEQRETIAAFRAIAERVYSAAAR
ncbi:MAG: thioredoxin family protein [Dehalococcoidia bacterium]